MAFEITQLTDATDRALVGQLVQIVNAAYSDSEGDIWIAGHLRTTEEDMVAAIQRGEIFVARHGTELVGTVRIVETDERSLEWGQLAGVGARRGLGRAIAAYVEDRARSTGRSVVTLEVLVPNTYNHPAKDRLQAWYLRMGYDLVRKGDLAEMYPTFVKARSPRRWSALTSQDLNTPCDYVFCASALPLLH